MRKAAILLALLFVLSVGGVCFAAAGVYEAHDQVALTETVVYADRTAAEGLTVEVRANYDDRLLWDTTCTVGEGLQVETVYDFSASRVREDWPDTYDGINLSTEIDTYRLGETDAGEPKTGMALAYQELYDETPPGEEGKKEVYLKDYVDYFPLGVSLSFPTEVGSGGMAWSFTDDGIEPGSELYALQKVRDYFKIPVRETDRLSIRVSKDENGTARSMGNSASAKDFYFIENFNAMTDSACYFTFDARAGDGRVVDTSHLPEGYGIYRLPYTEETIDADALDMVYPLDPETEILALGVDPEQTRLLLHAVEGGAYVLTVIDLASMDTLQKLEIVPWPEGERGWDLHDAGGHMTVLLGTGRLALITVTEEGDYALELLCEVRNDQVPSFPAYRRVTDFDGERLVLAGLLQERERLDSHTLLRDVCGFYLAVYDEDGLAYYGEYRSSLDTGTFPNDESDYCGTANFAPLRVRWP